MDVLIAGGSGYIGRRIKAALEVGGHTVRVLSRSPERGNVVWDPDDGLFDPSVVNEVDVVITAMGVPITGRLTDRKKERVMSSRVRPTQLLAKAIAEAERRPHTFVSMSAINYYGDRGDEVIDESTSPGEGFLADVTHHWEAATEPAAAAGVRVAIARVAPVMGRGSDVFTPLYRVFSLGLGGKMGSGEQYWSWISDTDVGRAFAFLVEREDLSGPFNLCAPDPMRNAEFAETLGEAMSRPSFFTVPEFALKLALGQETPEELLLGSLRVMPTRLLEAGFEFRHPRLEDAFADIL